MTALPEINARRSNLKPLWKIALSCLVGVAALGATFSCSDAPRKQTITIYTSLYENVISEISPILEKEFPELNVRWYQSGSEEVLSKLNAEIAAGRVKADIIMTSDPFWYEELKNAGHLMAYESPAADQIPAALKDPDHYYVTVRVPVMVMVANTNALPEAERPAGFSDLTDAKWTGRVTMGNPLKSGTNFTTVAAISKKYGWEYYETLRKNDAVSAGGNSSVISRVSTGEADVGIVLLENILKTKSDNPAAPIEIIYPADGAVIVPSPIAITSATANPEAARRIYDFMLSDAGQEAIVHANMYSPIDRIAPPRGARPWKEIREGALLEWSPEYLRATIERREEIKNEFSRIMFE